MRRLDANEAPSLLALCKKDLNLLEQSNLLRCNLLASHLNMWCDVVPFSAPHTLHKGLAKNPASAKRASSH